VNPRNKNDVPNLNTGKDQRRANWGVTGQTSCSVTSWKPTPCANPEKLKNTETAGPLLCQPGRPTAQTDPKETGLALGGLVFLRTKGGKFKTHARGRTPGSRETAGKKAKEVIKKAKERYRGLPRGGGEEGITGDARCGSEGLLQANEGSHDLLFGKKTKAPSQPFVNEKSKPRRGVRHPGTGRTLRSNEGNPFHSWAELTHRRVGRSLSQCKKA